MADERVERKLAAILAVDVAGYSRLMGEDETGTREPACVMDTFAIIDEANEKVTPKRGRLIRLLPVGEGEPKRSNVAWSFRFR